MAGGQWVLSFTRPLVRRLGYSGHCSPRSPSGATATSTAHPSRSSSTMVPSAHNSAPVRPESSRIIGRWTLARRGRACVLDFALYCIEER